MENNWWIDKDQQLELLQAGQYFAAGFLFGGNESVYARHAAGVCMELMHAPLPEYKGETIYPASPMVLSDQVVYHNYVAIDLAMRCHLADQLLESAKNDTQKQAFSKLAQFCREYPKGGGYTHSIVHFSRVLSEGLDSYSDRIAKHLSNTKDSDKQDLYTALLALIDGIDNHRRRIAEYLQGLRFEDVECEANRQALLSGYESSLPMRPAHGFREAMQVVAFIYHIDGYDDLGRFDQFMWPYYDTDIRSGRISREQAGKMIKDLWRLVDLASGWNVALGGSTEEGEAAANDLTALCLEVGKGGRRPNLALRLRTDTPDYIWDAALDCISGGSGIPALYGEENYLKAIDMAQLNVSDEDKYNFAFGGCTELMVQGCSNVGSLDADINVIRILSEFLPDALANAESFEQLLQSYKHKLAEEVYSLTDTISNWQQTRSQYHPQMIRTLLIDDCIDRGRSYYNGGARCNWSVVNVTGLSNTLDSLAAIKHAVFDEKSIGASELIAALENNFADNEQLRAYLLSLPKFGNDDPDLNQLARDLSGFLYREFKRYAPWRGGKFICGTLMFTTYAMYGEQVGATAEGRKAGTPVGDSVGPVQGRDKKGPTAMLQSTASLSQLDAPGTLVLNMRVNAEMFKTPENRKKLRALVESYFALGGMQLQLNVVDQKVLQDACERPEEHKDLVVRMGGYSEYWENLTPALRLSVLERTEHSSG